MEHYRVQLTLFFFQLGMMIYEEPISFDKGYCDFIFSSNTEKRKATIFNYTVP